ncbi:hypothetical protein P0092_08175 [Ruminiclostridium papyrosolvens DSM 2782]|uniref:hypothetical protein n=1 Tax=Ruminiclostridium papyrosolvens TaxID=29362 RepID=UPI0003044A83|nr:hypothetical protein [Ruminiclostridium papyrosolvens]WES35926.1 hypothetical protein P0092_08175 [Ruminiclostridium papyrosolvens DSM 2782]
MFSCCQNKKQNLNFLCEGVIESSTEQGGAVWTENPAVSMGKTADGSRNASKKLEICMKIFV